MSIYNTYASASQSAFDNIFPIARRVAATTIGFDLVSVQPRSGPTGHLFYMDFEKGQKENRISKIKNILENITSREI